MPYRPLPLALPMALLVLAVQALAGDVKVYHANDRVDPEDVARILDRTPPKLGKWRSLRLIDDNAAAAPMAVATQALPAAPGGSEALGSPGGGAEALSLPVPFAFDSAEILPQAREQLDAIAGGIRRLPAERAVVIEGHTDSVGPDPYNEALSLRRAHAVRRYLVAVHGIEARRLRAVGLGEYAPLPGTDPVDASNRRVQFRGE